MVPGSEADQRGLFAKDVIVAVGNQPVESAKELSSIINKQDAGDAVLLRVKGADKRTRYVAVEVPKH